MAEVPIGLPSSLLDQWIRHHREGERCLRWYGSLCALPRDAHVEAELKKAVEGTMDAVQGLNEAADGMVEWQDQMWPVGEKGPKVKAMCSIGQQIELFLHEASVRWVCGCAVGTMLEGFN